MGTLTSASGRQVKFAGNSVFGDFYAKFKGNLKYQLYIEHSKDAQVVFTGKDTSKVLGAIYEVTEGCLRQLDKYEGSDYRRLNVIVNNEDGEPVEAVTYIRSGQAEPAKPSQEYLAILQQGYKDWRLV